MEIYRFQHSTGIIYPLTEIEWLLLKRIEENVYDVDAKLLKTVHGHSDFCSVYVEDRQVFESGRSKEEAKDATIKAALDIIQDLEIDIDQIYFGKQPKSIKESKGK